MTSSLVADFSAIARVSGDVRAEFIDATPYCIISDFILLQNFRKDLYDVTVIEDSRSSVLF